MILEITLYTIIMSFITGSATVIFGLLFACGVVSIKDGDAESLTGVALLSLIFIGIGFILRYTGFVIDIT